MNILITILLIIGGIIILILLLGLFMRKDHYVKREIIINAPQQKVFDYVRFIKHQEEFNKHAKAGGEREKKFTGTDGAVGYIYAWKGDKSAGEGEKEIKRVTEGKSVEMEIRFVKPMKAVATIIMDTEAITDQQTKLSWSNGGRFNYPLNIMIPVMEKMLPKDMDESLRNLKQILEK